MGGPKILQYVPWTWPVHIWICTHYEVAGQAPEDIDVSHRRTLDTLLGTPEWAAIRPAFAGSAAERCIAAWHEQPAWPDVAAALAALRGRGYETFVHANETVRLQLDLVRSSGLRGLFDALFSSELLGTIKPAPESYMKCLGLLGYRPEECVMVAAHAYDTRGAKVVGMKTVYVYRWTDDIRENQEVVRGEHDVYLEGMDGLVEAVVGLHGRTSPITLVARLLTMETSEKPVETGSGLVFLAATCVIIWNEWIR
ncbi:haloacid dehalogenase, type II [Roridomyces roridus]|uniref:Haloacid dehalogenase, type II n=1 Tax=Roridomyces roridus TaxID=1738132 RepID=A0AAD7AZ73_9AGAR|nr:haloacid dehalogenase, type II [Roridomyces roridus]